MAIKVAIKRIILISRPRIWFYMFGWYWFGAIAGSHDPFFIFQKQLLPLSLYLTFPANFFIYAINDAFDIDTDAGNPRKSKFEFIARSEDRRFLLTAAFIFLLPLFFIISRMPVYIIALVFLWFFLILSYNIPPIRFKTMPILDVLFAFNYPLWGAIGYFLVIGNSPPLLFVVAGAAFAAIMHIYSASLDIDYDRKVGIRTTATAFKTLKNNLFVCLISSILIGLFFLIIKIPIVSFVFWGYSIFFFLNLLFEKYFSAIKWYTFFIILHLIIGLYLVIAII